MKATQNPISVADYCQGLNDKKIIVNQDYQRQGGLWAPQARSFFIESVLLGYPIPKLFLYSRLDLKTREVIKEIVDGQQRSLALLAFYNNKLQLSRTLETEELRGLKYQQLSEEWQTNFLAYSLPVDQFSGIPENEVREAFRRMNANNIPLNAEEQRNARYQGKFKWFIISIAKEYQELFLALDLFSRRDVLRMLDLRLYAQIIHTLDGRFQTQKSPQIDAIYRKYNTSFLPEEEYREKLRYGLEYIIQNEQFHERSFLKSAIVQTIILAAIAIKFGGEFDDHARQTLPVLEEKLSNIPILVDDLLQTLIDPDAYPELLDFSNSCRTGTNIEKNRITRFLYFKHAMLQE